MRNLLRTDTPTLVPDWIGSLSDRLQGHILIRARLDRPNPWPSRVAATLVTLSSKRVTSLAPAMWAETALGVSDRSALATWTCALRSR
jgi:hypothetical protein